MRSEAEGVEPPGFPQLVEGVQVGIDVEAVVIVGRVVPQVPLGGRLHVLLRPPLRLALIVNHVKTYHLCSQNLLRS